MDLLDALEGANSAEALIDQFESRVHEAYTEPRVHKAYTEYFQCAAAIYDIKFKDILDPVTYKQSVVLFNDHHNREHRAFVRALVTIGRHHDRFGKQAAAELIAALKISNEQVQRSQAMRVLMGAGISQNSAERMINPLALILV